MAYVIYDAGQVIDGLIDCTLKLERYQIAAALFAEVYHPTLFEAFLVSKKEMHSNQTVVKFVETLCMHVGANRSNLWNIHQIIAMSSHVFQ